MPLGEAANFQTGPIAVDGTIYLTWMRCVANGPANDCGGTRVTMMISRSTDGGNTWSHPAAFARPKSEAARPFGTEPLYTGAVFIV